jgi:hypothetical protein
MGLVMRCTLLLLAVPVAPHLAQLLRQQLLLALAAPAAASAEQLALYAEHIQRWPDAVTAAAALRLLLAAAALLAASPVYAATSKGLGAE